MKVQRIVLWVAALAFALHIQGSEGAGLQWKNAKFRDEFLGSFGVNSGVEPAISEEDRLLMQQILPLLEADDTVGAIELMLKERLPESGAIIDFTLGNLYYQQDDLDAAVKYYQAAIDKFPAYRRAHKNLGLLYVRNGEHRRAVSQLSQVIQSGAGDGLTYGLLGHCYLTDARYMEAESAFRMAVLLQPELSDWRKGLLQSILKQQKYGEAIAMAENMLADDPENTDIWLLQANAYIGLKQPMKAAQNYELMYRAGTLPVEGIYTLGDIYVNEQLWDLAVRTYLAGWHADPGAVGRALRNVEVLARRGALRAARNLLADIRAGGADRFTRDEQRRELKLEARLAVAAGEGGQAVGVLEKIVELDPLDGEALMLLGQHYTDEQDLEKAEFCYERAKNIEEYEVGASIRLAQLLVLREKYKEAVPLLRRVQEMEPREDVAGYLEQVEKLSRAR